MSQEERSILCHRRSKLRARGEFCSRAQSEIFQLTNCASKGNWGRYSKLRLQKMWILLQTFFSNNIFSAKIYLDWWEKWKCCHFTLEEKQCSVKVIFKYLEQFLQGQEQFPSKWFQISFKVISFKVISRFPIRELQLPPCHLHLSLILIQVLMYFLGKETQFYINYKSINPSYILGSVYCLDLNLSREGCPSMNI